MNYLRHWLYARNKPEPLRQASLLLMIAGAVGHGDTLLETLNAHERESSGEWREKIRLLITLLESGHSLSVSMSLVENLLPAATISAVTVAESGGCLSSVLLDEARRVSQMAPAEQAGRVTPEVMLVWFGCFATVIFSLLLFLSIFLVPKYKAVFSGFGVELPAMTLIVFSTFELFGEYWYFTILPSIGLTVGSLWLFWTSGKMKLMRGYLPLARHWPRYWTPGVLRILGIGIATKSPVSLALDATIQELPEGRAATRMLELRDRVAAGTDLLNAMRDTKLISSREWAFLRSSETTGHSDWAMRHLAEAIDRKRQRRVSYVFSLLNNTLTLGFGALVLCICVAWFLPLVKLIGDLS